MFELRRNISFGLVSEKTDIELRKYKSERIKSEL